MSVKSRAALYQLFRKGYIPAESDFRDLIDSSLNRKDDRFFGCWRPGAKYCNGDVVLYGKGLYQLRLEEEPEPCPPEGDETPQDTTDKEESCICSTEPPDTDKRWCLLELEMDDKDWVIIEDEQTGEVTTVYNVKARIGIGTDSPQSKLEIAGESGSIRVEPQAEGDRPAISLLHFAGGGNGSDRAAEMALDRRLEWTTDTIGYAFFREAPPSTSGDALKQKGTSKADDKTELPVLMLIASDTVNRPVIGIGHEDPEASLDAISPDRGRVMLNPFATGTDAALLMLDIQSMGNGYFSLAGVNQEVAYWHTNAAGGFRLVQGGDIANLQENMGQGRVNLTVLADGKTGIGTETPRSLLEVTDNKSGAVRVDFSQDNVCISAINQRPNPQMPVTYLATGVDDDFGTFVTDAPQGFLFKKGMPHGQHDSEVNINQGDKIAFLSPEGKLGLQTPDTPQDYDLDVNGEVRSLTAYLSTDGAWLNKTGDLSEEEVLSRLEKLHPIKFKWKPEVNVADDAEQFGFNAQNVFECFPQLVKKTGSIKSVAYGNLTAVLVQAIKEQQVLIKELEQRICDLEEQSGNPDTAS